MDKTSKSLANKISNTLLNIFWYFAGSVPLRLIWQKIWGEHWRGIVLRWGMLNVHFLCKVNDQMVLCGNWSCKEVMNYHQAIGKNGRLLVMEANAETSKRVAEEFDKQPNNHPKENVRFIPKGIWNKKCNLQMVQSLGDYSGFDRLATEEISEFPEQLQTKTREVSVSVDSLDNIILTSHLERVDLVVLTVNGAETAAFQGMSNLLEQNPKLRIIVNSNYPQPFNKLTELMKTAGMSVYYHKPKQVYWKDPDFNYACVYACK